MQTPHREYKDRRPTGRVRVRIREERAGSTLRTRDEGAGGGNRRGRKERAGRERKRDRTERKLPDRQVATPVGRESSLDCRWSGPGQRSGKEQTSGGGHPGDPDSRPNSRARARERVNVRTSGTWCSPIGACFHSLGTVQRG